MNRVMGKWSLVIILVLLGVGFAIKYGIREGWSDSGQEIVASGYVDVEENINSDDEFKNGKPSAEEGRQDPRGVSMGTGGISDDDLAVEVQQEHSNAPSEVEVKLENVENISEENVDRQKDSDSDKSQETGLFDVTHDDKATLVDEESNLEYSEESQVIESSDIDQDEESRLAEEEALRAALAAQLAFEKAEQLAHPELYRGSDYLNIINTYPWQGDCPDKEGQGYVTVWDGYYIGGYACECVSYVGWKAYETYDLVLAWGNAYSWDNRARAAGYVVDKTPEANSIGQIDGGAYGHVFWVESVNDDGSINVTEYNNSYATYLYSGHSHYGDFGARTISVNEANRYNYIHLKQRY